MNHDPLCAQARYRSGRCMCELIAEVRADERAKVDCYLGPCWDGCVHAEAHTAALGSRDHELAHAEAVAARLVDVICAQDERMSTSPIYQPRLWRCGVCDLDWLPRGGDRQCPMCALRAERDRLRAEVADMARGIQA